MPNRAAPRTCHHAWMASTLAYDRVDDLRQSEVGRFRFLIDGGALKTKDSLRVGVAQSIADRING